LQFYSYVLRTFKRTDKETEVYEAYNETIKHLANLKGMEGLKFQSWIPTVVGQEDYPLPSTLCHVIHPVRFIEAADQESGYPLNKRTKEWWSAAYPNPNITNTSNLTKGRPADYCVFSNSLLLGPAPDKTTYIIELDWAKLPTSQDADSDIHQLGTDWDEVIKYGALARLYESVGMTDEADRFWILYRHEELGYPVLVAKEKDKHEKMRTIKNKTL